MNLYSPSHSLWNKIKEIIGVRDTTPWKDNGFKVIISEIDKDFPVNDTFIDYNNILTDISAYILKNWIHKVTYPNNPVLNDINKELMLLDLHSNSNFIDQDLGESIREKKETHISLLAVQALKLFLNNNKNLLLYIANAKNISLALTCIRDQNVERLLKIKDIYGVSFNESRLWLWLLYESQFFRDKLLSLDDKQKKILLTALRSNFEKNKNTFNEDVYNFLEDFFTIN